MNQIDYFTVMTRDGNTLSVAVMQVLNDPTWFEVYAANHLLGKIHWRADTDGYMVVGPDGDMWDHVASFSEAEDVLVREAGYYITIPTVKGVSAEHITPSDRDRQR